MTSPASELVPLLCRCQSDVAAALRRVSASEERAARLAELLLGLIDDARLTACLPVGAGSDRYAIRPENALVAERRELLRSRLSCLDPLAASVQTLPAEGSDGLRLLAVAMQESGCFRGYLAVGLASDAEEEEVARAAAVLAVAAPTAARCWSLEALRTEQDELERFALVGQAFVGLAHDLNNALNSMMLQTSVLQLRVDERWRPDLAAIRQQGAHVAGMVRSLHHVVQERREQAYPVDLNAIVAEVFPEESPLGPAASLHLSEDDPRVHSTRGAVKQIVRLLLQGACGGTKRPLRVRTTKVGEGAVLILEIAGMPSATTEDGAGQTDALFWQNLDEVGRQAGQSLLRQMGGTLEIRQTSEGVTILSVTWEGLAAVPGAG